MKSAEPLPAFPRARLARLRLAADRREQDRMRRAPARGLRTSAHGTGLQSHPGAAASIGLGMRGGLLALPQVNPRATGPCLVLGSRIL